MQKIDYSFYNMKIFHAREDAIRDIIMYEKFKLGKVEKFTNKDLLEMNILNTLERLGYPMDMLGTYLCKDIVLKIINNYENKNLLNELNYTFSQFYNDIANNDKEIGIKTFNLYVHQALDNINEENIDEELYNKIFFSDCSNKYGFNFLRIAKYVKNNFSGNEKQKMKVKV